jgi:hypothetical protein
MAPTPSKKHTVASEKLCGPGIGKNAGNHAQAHHSLLARPRNISSKNKSKRDTKNTVQPTRPILSEAATRTPEATPAIGLGPSNAPPSAAVSRPAPASGLGVPDVSHTFSFSYWRLVRNSGGRRLEAFLVCTSDGPMP